MSSKEPVDREPSILVAIPHYFGKRTTRQSHGSMTQRRASRAEKLRRTVEALHVLFGRLQCMMQLSRRQTEAANLNLRGRVEVLVCSTPEDHLAEESGLGPAMCRLCREDVAPEHLGFAVHRRLAERLDDFDWFVYLEDDLLMHDPLWFTKLSWFLETAGQNAVLLPNRYERSADALMMKAYVDGDLRPESAGAFQDRSVRPEICEDVLGRPFRFIRPLNPHAGCFALRKDQLAYLIAQPDYGQPREEFIGPLESAATLAVMSHFQVFKPAIENASFLEIEHQSNQFIGQLRRP